MKKVGDKFFWISYSDLMTSMFFIMLILFAIISTRYMRLNGNSEDLISKVEKLEAENKDLKRDRVKLEGELNAALATLEQQKRIIDIDKQFKPLKESESFIYDEQANKYIAKDFIGIEIFDPNKSTILPQYLAKTMKIEKEMESILKKLHRENPDFGYVLVIEGNAANSWDKRFDKDDNYGYTLSYSRALAVYKLWLNGGINLRRYNTEILIAGSGFNGLFRDKIEDNNKRFTIQIIPKVRPAVN